MDNTQKTENEVLERYPSGAVKKTIIRGGTTQGHDILKTYHHKGKFQESTYQYNASDGSILNVREDGYTVRNSLTSELHNPDGPAKMVYRSGRPDGYCYRNGRLFTEGNRTFFYYNEGKLITGRPAKITIGDQEELYNSNGKLIRSIDHHWGRNGLIVDQVYDDGIVKKRTTHLSNGDVKFLDRYSEGKEIRSGMNPDLLEARFVESNLNYDKKYHILDVEERKVEYLGHQYDHDNLKWDPKI